MNRIDHSDLDGRLLGVLLAVLETGSVTAAAQRLGVAQSAVSHQIARLRAITADPLFVKAGRGITPTARARALATPARDLLQAMERFARREHFAPEGWQGQLTIAANDYQRDLVLPGLAAVLRAHAPDLVLRIVPSQVPTLEMLREGPVQLAITPRPPDGSDLLQRKLFEDRWQVVHDPRVRPAPGSRADFQAAGHVGVVYESGLPLDIDLWLSDRGVQRRFQVLAPGLAAVAPFVVGSRLLATLPSRLGGPALLGLAASPLPLPGPRLAMFMVWHRRHHDDPAHTWLRARLVEVAHGG
jgi:DNA-binding transcriptional LysR family regulator